MNYPAASGGEYVPKGFNWPDGLSPAIRNTPPNGRSKTVHGFPYVRNFLHIPHFAESAFDTSKKLGHSEPWRNCCHICYYYPCIANLPNLSILELEMLVYPMGSIASERSQVDILPSASGENTRRF
jgi:hypothetical protein